MKTTSITLFLCLVILSVIAQTTSGGLKVNDPSPDFTAYDQNGKSINLKNQLTHGPVVLVFYRGEWCPYCNKQLKELEDSLKMITDKGATVIAVSPETRENVLKTIGKTKAKYSIISDDKMRIMSAYKVAFALDEELVKKYKGYGINLEEKNGNNGNNLPVPAVYIIDKNGKIKYSHYDENYKARISVREILALL